MEKVRVGTKITSQIAEPLLKGISAAQLHINKGEDTKRSLQF